MNTRYEIFIKKILTGLPNSELSKLVNEKKNKNIWFYKGYREK